MTDPLQRFVESGRGEPHWADVIRERLDSDLARENRRLRVLLDLDVDVEVSLLAQLEAKDERIAELEEIVERQNAKLNRRKPA